MLDREGRKGRSDRISLLALHEPEQGDPGAPLFIPIHLHLSPSPSPLLAFHHIARGRPFWNHLPAARPLDLPGKAPRRGQATSSLEAWFLAMKAASLFSSLARTTRTQSRGPGSAAVLPCGCELGRTAASGEGWGERGGEGNLARLHPIEGPGLDCCIAASAIWRIKGSVGTPPLPPGAQSLRYQHRGVAPLRQSYQDPLGPRHRSPSP